MGKLGNPVWGLIITIVIPVVILTQFSDRETLGPSRGLVLALGFPVSYGIWELVQSRRYNFYAILGIITVLLTGGIAWLQLDPKWLAVKEAAVPLVIGVVILISQRTRWPLVKTVLNQMVEVDGLAGLAASRNKQADFQRSLAVTADIAAGSFIFSAVLNYTLANLIVQSSPGTVAFNEELGKLTAWSYPAIALPSTLILAGGLFYLVAQLERVTGLEAVMIIKKYRKT